MPMTTYKMEIEIHIQTTAKDSPEERQQLRRAVWEVLQMSQAMQKFNRSNGAARLIRYDANTLVIL